MASASIPTATIPTAMTAAAIPTAALPTEPKLPAPVPTLPDPQIVPVPVEAPTELPPKTGVSGIKDKQKKNGIQKKGTKAGKKTGKIRLPGVPGDSIDGDEAGSASSGNLAALADAATEKKDQSPPLFKDESEIQDMKQSLTVKIVEMEKSGKLKIDGCTRLQLQAILSYHTQVYVKGGIKKKANVQISEAIAAALFCTSKTASTFAYRGKTIRQWHKMYAESRVLPQNNRGKHQGKSRIHDDEFCELCREVISTMPERRTERGFASKFRLALLKRMQKDKIIKPEEGVAKSTVSFYLRKLAAVEANVLPK